MPKIKREISKEELIEIIRSETNRRELFEKFGIQSTRFYQELKNYKVTIKFVRNDLSKEIISHVSKVGQTRVANELQVHNKFIAQLKEGVKISNKTLIKFLNFYDVTYNVLLTPTQEGKGTWKEIEIQADVVALKQPTNKKMNKKTVSKHDIMYINESEELLLRHRETLKKMLERKGIGECVISEVVDKFDMGCRESALIGIFKERIGQGKQMEETIFRKLHAV